MNTHIKLVALSNITFFRPWVSIPKAFATEAGLEEIAVRRRTEANVVAKRFTLFSIISSIKLETKKKVKNGFKRLHNKRKARESTEKTNRAIGVTY